MGCYLAMLFSQMKNQKGQGLVEYGLILGLISVLAVAALTLAGTSVQSILQSIADKLAAVAS